MGRSRESETPPAVGEMTMKAAYIETTGGPEVIRYGDLPRPTAQERTPMAPGQA